jgi:hypothetical protein
MHRTKFAQDVVERLALVNAVVGVEFLRYKMREISAPAELDRKHTRKVKQKFGKQTTAKLLLKGSHE